MSAWKMMLWGLVALVAILVALQALAVITNRAPYWSTDSSVCCYCRAYREERRLGAMRLPARVHLNAFTRFWYREVEPGHKHEWWQIGSGQSLLWGFRLREGTRPTLPGDDASIAVLRALPPSARKAFVDWICRAHSRPLSAKDEEYALRLAERIDTLYHRNPGRRDWPRILRRMGFHIKRP